MLQDKPKAKKIRFNRDALRDLNSLPSAITHQRRRIVVNFFGVLLGLSRFVFAALAILFLGVMLLAAILVTKGISNSYFSQLAASSLQKLVGTEIISNIGRAKLSLDRTGNLAFQGEQITFLDRTDNAKVAHIGSIRIGLSALPLFLGKVETARLEIDDVVISRLNIPGRPLRWLDQLTRADGLYAPGELPALVHGAAKMLSDQFKSKGAREIVVNNIAFDLGQNVVFPFFESVRLRKGDGQSLLINAAANRADQSFVMSGVMRESEFSFLINGLTAGPQTTLLPPEVVADITNPIAPNAQASLVLRGYTVNNTPALQAALSIDRFDFRNRRGVRVAGDAKILAEVIQGVDKIEIAASQIKFGDNSSAFTGAIGPQPEGERDARYRFEFVSNDTSLKPQGSPEDQISAAILLKGTLSQSIRQMSFSQIALRTLGGQLTGTGDVVFGKGSPALTFDLSIPEMSIAHGKQLWPAIFAGGARAWVMANVLDGTLANSTIKVAYQAGDIGISPKDPPTPLPTEAQVSADFTINNARFNTIGELPIVSDAFGSVAVRGANTTILLSKGLVNLDKNQVINVSSGTIAIPVRSDTPVIAAMTLNLSGKARSLAEVANRQPINALNKAPLSASDLSGTAEARITASFPLRKKDQTVEKKWTADIAFQNLSIAKEFGGQTLSDADGTLQISKSEAIFDAKGKLNGVPATLSVREPLGGSGAKRDVSAKLMLDDNARAKIVPGLKDMLSGPVQIVFQGASGDQKIEADLTRATLSLPWAGWSKGAGIAAKAVFTLSRTEDKVLIKNLKVSGKTFSIAGDVDVIGGKLVKADFSNVSLNRGDAVAVALTNDKNGFDVSVSGRSLDLRALLKRITGSFEKAASSTGGVPIRVRANLDTVTGFNGEDLKNVVASYSGKGSIVRSFTASANSRGGGNIAIENKSTGDRRTVQIQTSDGGALLSFMNIYDKMSGGTVNVNLSSNGDGPLSGEVDAVRFTVVGEPRLKSLVGTPTTPDGQSLSNVAKGKLEVSRVKFERGNAIIEKGKGYLKLERGILRSEQIGLSYSGTLYDPQGRINMVGTFMPAFGLNRIFSALPILGEILGNGRDKGLIGITFKLAGDAKTPTLSVNPISLIAPGIFRQIFEFQ